MSKPTPDCPNGTARCQNSKCQQLATETAPSDLLTCRYCTYRNQQHNPDCIGAKFNETLSRRASASSLVERLKENARIYDSPRSRDEGAAAAEIERLKPFELMSSNFEAMQQRAESAEADLANHTCPEPQVMTATVKGLNYSERVDANEAAERVRRAEAERNKARAALREIQALDNYQISADGYKAYMTAVRLIAEDALKEK